MSSSKISAPLLRIATHNAQGLNSPVKRRKAFQDFQRKKIDIALLQETHFPSSYKPTFLHANYPTFYTANADNKTKGVAILFSKNCHFSLIKEIKDPEGRFILIKGNLAEQLFSFVSYYAPNQNSISPGHVQ